VSQDATQLLDDVSPAGQGGDIVRFVGVGLMIIQLAGNDPLRTPVAPLDIAVAIGADGIAHDVAAASVATALAGAGILAERGSFPRSIRVGD
jgi:hypothetical protein